jgi:hypothetical protein
LSAVADKSFLRMETARAKWVAIAAALASICFVVASIVAGPALNDVRAGSSADLLVAYDEDPANAVIVPSVFRALSFGLMGVPLLYLYVAARNRNPRVRREFVGFFILGPALIALQFLLLANSLVSVGEDFVGQDPDPTVQERVADSDDPDAVDEDSEREQLADDLIEDSGGVSAAQFMSLAGFLSFGISLFYAGLWSMRTGLLSRFNGSFAMALGVVTAIPFFSQIGAFGSVIWMAFLAVFFFRDVSTRPPAWAEGREIPWPKPGTPVEPAEGGTVEGSGREVLEKPLPEGDGAESSDVTASAGAEPDAAEAEVAPPGESQGQRRKKRKRRS